jgi:phosphoribosylformylglycinamidine cyclo-ligase
VPEILDIIAQVPSVKALIHITGDGLLNLSRVDAAIGFVLDALPSPPPIFDVIERRGGVPKSEMFEVFNMGVGFCVVTAAADADAVLAILGRHGHEAWVIGHAVANPDKSVHLAQHGLVGRGKRFQPA